eukprot:553449-Pelagomonas_calceolata.AAC.3
MACHLRMCTSLQKCWLGKGEGQEQASEHRHSRVKRSLAKMGGRPVSFLQILIRMNGRPAHFRRSLAKMGGRPASFLQILVRMNSRPAHFRRSLAKMGGRPASFRQVLVRMNGRPAHFRHTLVKMNGRPVPSTTLVMTIKNRDKEIAPAFSTLPLVAYTRANPPADKLVPVQVQARKWEQ